MKRMRLPWGAIAGVWLAAAGPLHAQVSTQESASVIVFPKVVVDGEWDTTIQIANGANRPTSALCHYVNAQLALPDQPPGPLNQPLWANSDFAIRLMRQQPTHWVASRGRSVGELAPCGPAAADCDSAGLPPGRVPPVPNGFVGELVCIEADGSGAPWSGNALRGQATLTHLATGEVVKYTAVGLSGFRGNDADGHLCLGGEPTPACPLGAEYAACPRSWVVSHAADFDDSPFDGAASRTTLTVVPCARDFAVQEPAVVPLRFRVTNEFEQSFSAAVSVQCWADLELGAINPVFMRDIVGSDWLQTRVEVAAGYDGGIMLVQQTDREQILPEMPTEFSAVATTPHQDGDGEEVDAIVLPEEVIP